MARKTGKKKEENLVECTGGGKTRKGNIRKGAFSKLRICRPPPPLPSEVVKLVKQIFAYASNILRRKKYVKEKKMLEKC